jgi:septal ring factor EnvC (AmiA/AmiB activator)
MPRTSFDRYLRRQTLVKGILLAFPLGFCIFTNQARADSLHLAMTDRAQELARIEKELDSKRARMEMLVRMEKEAFEELLDIEEKLELTRRLIGGLASRETATERKLLSEAKSLEEIRSELHSRRDESRRRLRTIYKYGRTVPQNVIWAGASPADLTSRIKFTRRILEADRNSVKAAEGRKVYLEENSQNLGRSVAELSLLGSVKTDEQGAYQGELREREKLLKNIRSEKKLYLQAIRELEKRAEKIRRTLGGFQEEGTHPRAEEPEGKAPLAG